MNGTKGGKEGGGGGGGGKVITLGVAGGRDKRSKDSHGWDRIR